MRDIISTISFKLSSFLKYFTLAIMIITIYGVITRWGIGRPDARAIFFGSWLLGIMSVMGGAYLLRVNGHTAVDVVYLKLSRRHQKILDIIDYMLLLFWGVITTIESARGAWYATKIKEIDFSLGMTFAPQIWWVKWFIMLGSLLLTLQAVVMLMERIKGGAQNA